MSVQEPVQKSPSLPTSQEEPLHHAFRYETQTQGKSRRLIQRQLILLLHAHNCQKKDRAFAAAYAANPNTPMRPKCQIQQCKNMKDVWEHMRRCNVGPECEFLHCASSLKILAHWKYCTTWECPVCHLIRLKGVQQVGVGLTMKAAETARALAPKQLLHSSQQISSPMNFSSCSSVPSPTHNHNESIHQQGQQNEEDNENYNDNMEQEQMYEENCEEYSQDENDDGIALRNSVNSFNSRRASVPTADDVRRAYEQLGIPCPNEALSRLMATLPGGENSCLNSPADKEDLNECSDSGFVPDEMPSIGASADDVVQVQADEAEAESQQWRQSMSSLERERLVRQIHEAICVTTTEDLGMGGIVSNLNSDTYARHIESEAYHFARTREDYYELISNRIKAQESRQLAYHGDIQWQQPCFQQQEQGQHHMFQTQTLWPEPEAHLQYESQMYVQYPQEELLNNNQQIDNGIFEDNNNGDNSWVDIDPNLQWSKKSELTPRTLEQLLEGFPCAGDTRKLRESLHSSLFDENCGCKEDCQGGPNCPFSLM